MKLVVTIILVVASCCVLNAQSPNKPNCPEGYTHTGGGWQIDKFNFHKPRTECTSKLGVCIEVSTFITCTSGVGTIRVFLDGNKVNNYISVLGDTAIFYLPLDIKNDPEWKGEDISEFEILPANFRLQADDHSWTAYLQGGVYKVEETSEYFMVRIPLEK